MQRRFKIGLESLQIKFYDGGINPQNSSRNCLWSDKSTAKKVIKKFTKNTYCLL